MARDKYSFEYYYLLDGIKRYLRIEHKDDDKDLVDYLRKQAVLHRDWLNSQTLIIYDTTILLSNIA